MMARAFSLRARAAFLALLIAPNLAVPAMDGLIAHRHPGESRAAGPHFEAPDFQCGHADRCVLGATLAGPRLAGHVESTLHEARQPVLTPQFTLPPLVFTADLTTPEQPRAPPPSLP